VTEAEKESLAQRQARVRERIEMISLLHNGRITPEQVVEDAKDPSSPLHGEFDWDLERAAHRSWLERARQIIRSVKVEIQTEEVTLSTIAYVRDPDATYDDQGYVATTVLRKNPDSAREALAYECERAKSALQRARDVAVALDLEDEVDDLLSRVDAMIEKARS
jgi:hypothetical protein